MENLERQLHKIEGLIETHAMPRRDLVGSGVTEPGRCRENEKLFVATAGLEIAEAVMIEGDVQ